MFNLPFDMGPASPEELAIAEAATRLRDTIDFVPHGHDDVKVYFLDISVTLTLAAAANDSSPQGVVDMLNHLEHIVRDIYSRLEVRL